MIIVVAISNSNTEEPVGVTVEEHPAGEGPIRLQAGTPPYKACSIR